MEEIKSSTYISCNIFLYSKPRVTIFLNMLENKEVQHGLHLEAQKPIISQKRNTIFKVMHFKQQLRRKG